MHPGYHQIFANGSGDNCFGDFTKPNEVYINGIIQKNIQPFYKFVQEENYAKLIWKITVTSYTGMFCNSGHILEANLSHFHTLQVTDMRIMLQKSKRLISIDF